MNDHNHNFFKSFEEASYGLRLSLRIECGLDSRAHIVKSKDGHILVFATDDTDSKTLKRFLGPILESAVGNKASSNLSLKEMDQYQHPGLDGKGVIQVELCPTMVGYLTARLQ